jgi:hypothetical protein
MNNQKQIYILMCSITIHLKKQELYQQLPTVITALTQSIMQNKFLPVPYINVMCWK